MCKSADCRPYDDDDDDQPVGMVSISCACISHIISNVESESNRTIPDMHLALALEIML